MPGKAEGGTTYILVVNVVWVAEVVSLLSGVTEISPSATVFAQVTVDPKQVGAASVDLSAPAELEQMQVGTLLQKFCSVFSAHDGDLGCTSLISNGIPLLDEVLIQQNGRQMYEKVKNSYKSPL